MFISTKIFDGSNNIPGSGALRQRKSGPYRSPLFLQKVMYLLIDKVFPIYNQRDRLLALPEGPSDPYDCKSRIQNFPSRDTVLPSSGQGTNPRNTSVCQRAPVRMNSLCSSSNSVDCPGGRCTIAGMLFSRGGWMRSVVPVVPLAALLPLLKESVDAPPSKK